MKWLIIALLIFLAYQWFNIDSTARADIKDNTFSIPGKVMDTARNFNDTFRESQKGSVECPPCPSSSSNGG